MLSKRIFSDSIILAIFPVIAYGMAYYFESGYLAYFEIPSHIIKIKIENFFLALTFIFFFSVALIAPLANMFLIIAKYLIDKEREHYLFLLVFVFVSLLCFLFLPLRVFLIVCALFAFLISLNYFFPLFEKGQNYREKFDRFRDHEIQSSEKRIGGVIEKFLGAPAFLFLLVCIGIIPGFSQMLGSFQAQKIRSLPVTYIDGRIFGLIRTYDDLSIYVSLNKNWKNLYEYDLSIGKKFKLVYEHRDTPSFSVEKIIVKPEEFTFSSFYK